MRRATRQTLLLALVAGALGIGSWLQLRQEQAALEPALTLLDPASVSRIMVSRNGGTTERFIRVDRHWRVDDGSGDSPDDARIAGLLAIARAPVRARRLLAELDPASIGLDPAQATLVMDDTRIAIGHLDAIDGDRYIRIDEQPVIARVPDRFSHLLFGVQR